MDYTSWQEIQKNELVRKRLAKRIVRECFRDGAVFENFHAQLAELDDDDVQEIMTDAAEGGLPVRRLRAEVPRPER